MGTTEERLNGLLDERDAEIEELQEKIKDLEARLRGSRNGWAAHELLDRDQKLPVPRLEILVRNAEYEGYLDGLEYIYRLVYRHLSGDVIGVPFGHTSSRGGPPLLPDQPISSIHMPRRDGAHMYREMATLGLPGFLVYGSQWENLAARRAEHLGPSRLTPWPKWRVA